MAATQTTNIGLNKPNRQDYVSVVSDINNNMDKIDAAIGALPSGNNLEARKADKVGNAVADHLAAFDANGNLKDSGKSPADFITEGSLEVASTSETQQIITDYVG